MKRSMVFILGVGLLQVAPLLAGDISGELSRKPWSGTFWPLRTCWMSFANFGQGLAPFEKYDNYLDITKGTNPLASLKEADPANGHNEAPEQGESWTGHCHGWAPASFMEPEPPESVMVKFDKPVKFEKLTVGTAQACKNGMVNQGVKAYAVRPGPPEQSLEFNIGDLKGMLTEIYTETRSNFYGTRYNKRTPDHNDPAYMDIKPNEFHRLCIECLKEKDQGFVVDIDPGYMVWNQPVYKFQSHWDVDGKIQHVTTQMWYANDNGVSPTFVGMEALSKTYTYDLTTDDQGNIVDGQWTGASIDDHPDFLWVPYAVIDDANNAGLDLNVVHEIIANAGKTVAVTNDQLNAPAASSDPTPGNSPTDDRDGRRRGLWNRIRDGIGNLFHH